MTKNEIIEKNVFYQIYLERLKREELFPIKTFTQRIIYSLKMTFIFYISFLHPIIGILIYLIYKYNYNKQAIWPKIGLLLGIYINLIMYLSQIIPLL